MLISKLTLSDIESLHGLFCKLVPEGVCVLNMYREHEWWQWHKWREAQPFTEQDLRAVIAYRRSELALGRQFPACMKFSYAIGRPDRFEEDLALAKARPKPLTDREQVLLATGRPPKPEKRVQMAAPLAEAALKRLKEAGQLL